MHEQRRELEYMMASEEYIVTRGYFRESEDANDADDRQTVSGRCHVGQNEYIVVMLWFLRSQWRSFGKQRRVQTAKARERRGRNIRISDTWRRFYLLFLVCPREIVRTRRATSE